VKKRILIIILVVCVTLSSLLVFGVLLPKYKLYKEKKEYENLLKNANIVVDLKDDLNVSFLSDARVSDFILNINGEVVSDYVLDTSTVGEMEVQFEYINEDNLKIPYSYKINVVDDVAPVIWLNNSYTITTDYDGELLEDIVCADNYDDYPVCEIVGDYNTKIVGEYPLLFQAKDASGNLTKKNFTLRVKEPNQEKPDKVDKEPTYTYFSDVVKKHKKNNTKVGIDVSTWQGDIDFEAVKNAGVEFVFVRVGSTKGIDGEYFVDNKFEQNINGFNRVGIPVGIYFYSYANSRDTAINNANWVLEQIKGKKVDLPVVYDWESWSFYNAFHQSFYSTTNNAKAFLDTINKAGYQGVLYSSKNYLDKVWFPIGYDVWLAHYTEQTNYQGDYSFWQLCSNGRIDGIKGNVDINVMYM